VEYRETSATRNCNSVSKTLHRKLNELSLNNTEESSIDKKWNEIKKAAEESAKEIIGEKKRIRNEGRFDEECKMVIKQKNLD
jgi:hypothetical protein